VGRDAGRHAGDTRAGAPGRPSCTYPGVIGCQLEGADLTSGDWDQSLVYDGALRVSEPPAAPVGKAQAEAAVAGILENLAVLTRAAGQLG
jgi:hypothetical protein